MSLHDCSGAGLGCEWARVVRMCREEARALQRPTAKTRSVRNREGNRKGRSCHHGEVFIELGFVACDACDAVASFYFLG